MKLPIVPFKKVAKRVTQKEYINKERTNSLLNYFILPNQSISSSLSETKNKIEIQEHKIVHKINHIQSLKDRNINLAKRNGIFFKHKYNKNSSNSCRFQSSYSNILNYIDSKTEDKQNDNVNYEKLFKNKLSSFKIKKEISSFIYSSPDKQKRLINYLSDKFNKVNTFKKRNNKTRNDSNKLIKIKVFKRHNDIKNKSNEEIKLENELDKDEDKTHIKEMSLFIDDKNQKLPKTNLKYILKNNSSYIKFWDNNVLKNILPPQLKIPSELSNEQYNFKTNEVNRLNRRLNFFVKNQEIQKYKYINNLDKNNFSKIDDKMIKKNDNTYMKKINSYPSWHWL